MASYPYPRLNDKVVLITGASAGIGEHTARLFAKCGSKLILIARREEKLKQLSESILQQNPDTKIHPIVGSVTEFSVLEKALSSLPSEFQKVDILVNNAGKALENKQAFEHDLKQVEEMIDTNVKGIFYMIKILLPKMKEANNGHIINIGSVAGLEGYVGGSAYCASKFAVEGLTEAIRKEVVAHSGIRVCCINPALTETEFSLVRFNNDTERAKKVYEGFDPLVGEDIADNICYVASRPPHVQISNLVVYPTNQASCTLLHRETK